MSIWSVPANAPVAAGHCAPTSIRSPPPASEMRSLLKPWDTCSWTNAVGYWRLTSTLTIATHFSADSRAHAKDAVTIMDVIFGACEIAEETGHVIGWGGFPNQQLR
ncbi:hypothetical protein Hypma_004198 [Hypsizygus marmoreus]|uniref:Uncharacterized protein n=1 Tax=Hypsizygus marmoreus TaxID=39966 RepID=A0A369J452_HYPMA|nr:hypothetical protein Hypma_004198 [Hypsizygus marmoreus]